jgi:hypothetical protein
VLVDDIARATDVLEGLITAWSGPRGTAWGA